MRYVAGDVIFFMFYAVIDHNLLTIERSKILSVIVHVNMSFQERLILSVGT